jgi:exonuclease VII large subunit
MSLLKYIKSEYEKSKQQTQSGESMDNSSVTYNELVQQQISVEQISMELDRSIYEAITEEQNMYNFNELMSSLEKHCSEECFAFAQELLGSDKVKGFLNKFKKNKQEKQEEKPKTRWERVKERLRQWWKAFTDLVKKGYTWVSEKCKELISKIKGDDVKYLKFASFKE